MRPETSRSKRRAWLLCLLLPLVAGAATPSDDYAYRYALDTAGGSAAWRVELTPAIYAASVAGADLRDVVVVNGQGRTVPFAPLPAAPARSHPFALRAGLLPLPASASNDNGVRVQRNSNGDIVIEQAATPASPRRPEQWLVDARRQVRLDRIEIDPASLPADSRFHLSVQASNDLQAWSGCSQSTEIVNVKRGGEAVQQHTLALSCDTPARYYRLSLRQHDAAPWDAAQSPQVELRGSYADPLDARMAARHWLTLTAAPMTTSTAGAGADYDYTLPAALPVEAVQVVLAGDNTVARFGLFDRDKGNERMLATITAVRVGTSTSEDPATPLANVRVQHLRLHTDTPLSRPPTLRLAWQPDVFVFLAEGSGPYSLLVGSYAARRGDYPLKAALERLRPRDAGANWQPPLAQLGAMSDAAGAAALRPPQAPFDWTRPLLWLVLIGGALAVTGMAWSLLRQSPREDDPR